MELSNSKYIQQADYHRLKKIGIDLGGTKIYGIILDEQNKELKRKKILINKDSDNYETILDSIVDLIRFLRSDTEVFSIGLGFPGPISNSPEKTKINSLIGKPIKADLEKVFQQKISVENDANCFVLAESNLGATKDYQTVFGMTIGTGIGGGITINRKIHRGRCNIAGEWGHNVMYPNGNDCYCGKKGCVETYISGPALEKRWTTLTGTIRPLVNIIQKSDINNQYYMQWKNEFLENFGMSIANIITTFDPDAVVIGGGVSNIPFLYDEGKEQVYKNVFSDYVDTPILKSKLGDTAGAIGAAMLHYL